MCVMLSWLLTLVLVLLVLISVLGNTLVCVAVKTDNTLRKLSNLFLVSLALADLFVRNSQILRSTDQLRQEFIDGSRDLLQKTILDLKNVSINKSENSTIK